MNTLELNYTNSARISQRRKRWLIVFGSILIAGSVTLLISLLTAGFRFSLLFTALANMLIGTAAILEAFQHKLLFPKKYLHINSSHMEYKLTGLKPIRIIEWASVEGVRISKNAITFSTANNRIRLSMLHFPSSDELKLKSAIKAIADTKGIKTES